MFEFIGRWLQGTRAGPNDLLLNRSSVRLAPPSILLTSPIFGENEQIPKDFTVEGNNISPPLNWSNVPAEAQELVLVVEDVDVPFPKPMVHLLIYSLSPATKGLAAGALPSLNDPVERAGYLLGHNSMGHRRYDGPAPIPGHGPHHYVFQIMALAESLLFDGVPDKSKLLEALKDKKVLATGSLTGTYER